MAASHKQEKPGKPMRLRFPPSPTGPLHIGGARTALFNWLFTKKHGGTFVLRIEDTDKERSEKKYETDFFEGLTWLGLIWDEGPEFISGDALPLEGHKGSYGPYRQSERTEIYQKYLNQLLGKGDAYYCYCTKEDLEAQRQGLLAQGLPPRYTGHCRNLNEPPTGRKPEVIRFKVPEVKVEWKDLVRGKVIFDAVLFGDMVIAKDLETPLYNFAVVVDDALMEITHVIRGEDHISNTPKQILMQKALGFEEPVYAHIPLILNPDRSKMSKRFTDTALAEYRKKGYLPEAMLNFLALLGWHPSGNEEVLSVAELIEKFDIARVQQGGAVFNEEKLAWLNKEHMKNLSDKKIVGLLEPLLKEENLTPPAGAPEDFLERMIRAERTRASTLRDFIEMGEFFFTLPDYEPSLLIWKEAPLKEVIENLKETVRELEKTAPETWDRETLLPVLSFVIGEKNRGVVLWPLRVALSGQSASPDPIEIMEVLGKDGSLKRIRVAIKKLEQ